MGTISDRVTLENLGKGAALELFESELSNVIANILDPNTKADTVRTITLKVKIKPDKKSRSMCALEVGCESKLAATMPFESTIFVGVEHGEMVASEYNPDQQRLPGIDEPKAEAKIAKLAVAGK